MNKIIKLPNSILVSLSDVVAVDPIDLEGRYIIHLPGRAITVLDDLLSGIDLWRFGNL